MSSFRRCELIEQMHNAASVEELHRCGSRFAESYGFEHFIYGASIPTSFVQPQTIIVSGYPQAWREHYIANGYQSIDPTVQHCARRLTPLSWADIDATVPVAQQMLQESRDFGLASGISLPTHGSNGEFAMFSLASHRPAPDNTAHIETVMADAYLLTAHFHEAARRILSLVQLPASNALSAREKECLRWSAEGKTSWEISQILGISERTVVFHLQHATEKLAVTNRQHAVARAITLGLIAPQFS